MLLTCWRLILGLRPEHRKKRPKIGLWPHQQHGAEKSRVEKLTRGRLKQGLVCFKKWAFCEHLSPLRSRTFKPSKKANLSFKSPSPKRWEKGRKCWDSLALLQRSFGPSGPKVGKRVGNEFPGPRSPKSRKRSRKRVKVVEKQSILTLFRLRFQLSGPWGREAPGTHFPTLFPTLGPPGPNGPCSGQKFSLRNWGKSPEDSGTGVTGRPGHRAMGMNGKSTASYLVHTLA